VSTGLSTEPADRTVGGRYRLLDALGNGGMGTVWRARDLVLDRDVAVKEVRPPRGVSDEETAVLRERTRREARLAARLDHPSAVTVYDVVEEDDRPFVVMELVDARTLSEVVRTDGPLDARRTAEVGLALLGALEAAHARGIVHRDVKPGNVLLAADGRVVLTDFGIATSTEDSSITSTGLLLGSPAYIAPERARGGAPGPASDLWSLGATLFTAVEGRPPFEGSEPLLTVTAVVTGDHAPFVAAGPLAPVLEGLLEKDPQRRLDAAQARAALEGVLASAPPATATPSPRPEAERQAGSTQALPLTAVHAAAGAPATVLPSPVRRPRRRRAGALAGLAVATAVAAVAGAVLVDRQQDAPAADAAPGVTVPAGWVEHVEAGEGWSLRHPPGWAVTERRGARQLRDEERRWTLRVSPASGEPAAALGAVASAYDRSFASYRQVRLAGSELEFTYSDDGADLHVLDRVVDGHHLYWQVPERSFAESRQVFEQLVASFRTR
jgi:eukaryotic-like serine/threonine-protein kinase